MIVVVPLGIAAVATAVISVILILLRTQAQRDMWKADCEKARAERDEITTELQSLIDHVKSGTDVMTDMQTALGNLNDSLTHERNRVKNLQSIIASVVDQRQFWAEWYHRQCSEHAAAQNMLIGEVSRLVFHVKQLGGKADLRAGLQQIVNEFADIHPRIADEGKPAAPNLKPLADRKVEGAP